MNHRQKKKRRKFESMMQEYGGAPSTYKEFRLIDRAYHELIVESRRLQKGERRWTQK